MRKTLAVLAVVGAALLMLAGPATAYTGETLPPTTAPPTTAPPTTAPATTAPPATAPPTTAPAVGAEGAETLPATGSDSLPLAQLGFLLVAAGGVTMLAMRHRTAKVRGN